MSDVTQIVIASLALVTTIFTGVMAYLMAKLNNKATAAAVKVDEVAVAADKTDKKVDQVAIQATKAATKVEAVATALVEQNDATSAKLDGLATVAHDTHTLVNSNMAVQLRLNSVVTRRLADMTKGTPAGLEDEKAANLAASLLKEHESKQAIVDHKTSENGREKDGAKDR